MKKKDKRIAYFIINILILKGYHFLARDKDGSLYAYEVFPRKKIDKGYWHLFRDNTDPYYYRKYYINSAIDVFKETKWEDDMPVDISNMGFYIPKCHGVK